ncbi:MAG: ribosomal protein L7/L12 [Myxococcales bacterium]|nr:ribosomal protein L7/L12 [Myxococcales bacterium]
METYRIRFLDGPTLLRSIDLVREFMGVGLREAKELVETHGVILERATAAEARRVAARFAEVGAQVMVERTWRYIYAYDPRHPARGDQPLQRLRAGEGELAIDSGEIGSWDRPDLQALALADHRGGLDPDQVERLSVERLRAWDQAGMRVAEDEFAVLEALSAREPKLEAALSRRPDDREAHLIYGDWLLAAGDPRGQLVALQCALESADADPEERLRARERAFMREHAGHLFGPLRGVVAETADTGPGGRALALRWSRGFIAQAFVGPVGWSRSVGGPFEILAGLLRLPVAACLQTLGLTSALLSRPELEGLLCASPVVAQLRALELGDHVDGRRGPRHERSWSRLWPQLRQLRRLRFHDDQAPLRTLHSPTLEHLELHLADLGRFHEWLMASERFVADRLPRLRALSLVFSRGHSLVPATFADLMALPDFDGIDDLSLEVRDEPLPSGLVEILTMTPRIGGLRVLDLSRCRVDGASLRVLEEARARGRLPEDLRLPQ